MPSAAATSSASMVLPVPGLALDQERLLQRDGGADGELQLVGGDVALGAFELHAPAQAKTKSVAARPTTFSTVSTSTPADPPLAEPRSMTELPLVTMIVRPAKPVIPP